MSRLFTVDIISVSLSVVGFKLFRKANSSCKRSILCYNNFDKRIRSYKQLDTGSLVKVQHGPATVRS